MAGFLLHRVKEGGGGPWPVSLASDLPRKEYLAGRFRLAVVETAHPSAARGVRFRDGVAWIEGKPLMSPEDTLEFRPWLAEADGSFRGVFFPSGEDEAVVFSDPYASRPVYYATGIGDACASDKVASLLPVLGRKPSIPWEVLLEAMAMGSVVSTEASVTGVAQVEAGMRVILEEGRPPRTERYRPLPNEGGYASRRLLWGDASELATAIRTAVRDTWGDGEAALLLSGGFDSRWVLREAPRGRRCITVMPGECRELSVVREVTAALGADLHVSTVGPAKWTRMLRESHLLTGGIYEPLKLLFNQAAEEWVGRGVQSVIHAHLFDTLFKGYYVFKDDEHRSFDTVLFPEPVFTFSAITFGEAYLRQLRGLLSEAGREALGRRLKTFRETTEWVRVRGNDFGYEKRLFGIISRLTDWPMTMGLMEYVAVQSPIFHRDIWNWWRHSHPANRKPCVAYLLAFLLSGGKETRIRKGDTGQTASRMLMRSLAGRYLPEAVKRMLRPGTGRTETPALVQETGAPANRSAWGVDTIAPAIRTPEGLAFLRENIGRLRGEPVFRAGTLDAMLGALDRPSEWDERLICFLASIGAWKGVVDGGVPVNACRTAREVTTAVLKSEEGTGAEMNASEGSG